MADAGPRRERGLEDDLTGQLWLHRAGTPTVRAAWLVVAADGSRWQGPGSGSLDPPDLYSRLAAHGKIILCRLVPRRWVSAQAAGRFIFRAGPAVACEICRAAAEGMVLPVAGEKVLGSLRRFPARHGLCIAWTGVEDDSPEPRAPARVPCSSARTKRQMCLKRQRCRGPKNDFPPSMCPISVPDILSAQGHPWRSAHRTELKGEDR